MPDLRRSVRIIGVIATVGLSISAAAPAQPIANVDGWRAAKWGMTEQQVLDVFKGEAQRLKTPDTFHNVSDSKALLTIPEFAVAGGTFQVMFGFSGAGTLNRVLLWSTKSNEHVFLELRRLLSEKYGKAVTEDARPSSGGGAREASWRFPRTVIRLHYANISPNTEAVTLTYAPPSSDTDKL